MVRRLVGLPVGLFYYVFLFPFQVFYFCKLLLKFAPSDEFQSVFFPFLLVQITMRMVPKMLSPLVKEWAPEAFVISFKLETDPSILISKARQALDKYRHQAVVANILDSRRTSVIVVTREAETQLSLSEDEVAQGVEIEEKIVSYLKAEHTAFMEK